MSGLLFGGTSTNVVNLLALAFAILVGIWIVLATSRFLRKFSRRLVSPMNDIIDELSALLSKIPGRLRAISEIESSVRPAPTKWSKKEILGHLIDSASNNHQRFVRAQLSGEIRLPGYEQEQWVQAQRYQHEPWEALIHLWRSYNLHLLHIIKSTPKEKLAGLCFIGESEPVTLEFLMRDYVRHLNHHLEQIFSS